jgi:hypothetical protein
MRKEILLSFLLLFSSCGYRLVGQGDNQVSLDVSPIKGDYDGALAKSIIEQIATRPSLAYNPFSNQYVLDVSFKQFDSSHVDYQYQTNDETDEIINRLSPVEGEQDLVVQVIVYHANSKKKILGPIEFRQTVQFDFSDFRSYNDLAFVDLSGISQTTLDYSLGQLAAEDDAKLSAREILFQKIAKKIAAHLEMSLDSN